MRYTLAASTRWPGHPIIGDGRYALVCKADESPVQLFTDLVARLAQWTAHCCPSCELRHENAIVRRGPKSTTACCRNGHLWTDDCLTRFGDCRACDRERRRGYDPVERARMMARLTPHGPYTCKACRIEFYVCGRSTTSKGSNSYCTRACQGQAHRKGRDPVVEARRRWNAATRPRIS